MPRFPDGVSGAARTGLAIYHRWSAAHLANLADSLERDASEKLEPRDEWMEARHRHRAYVVGSILSSVAFLEATINEKFSDAADREWSMPVMEHAPKHRDALANAWIGEVKRISTLAKYDLALRLGDLPTLEPGQRPRQDVELVLKIRNALVHHEPEWVYTAGRETPLHIQHQHRFQKAVSGRFADNPFTLSGDPYWPEKCLSASCAQWALRAIEKFVDEFERMVAGSS